MAEHQISGLVPVGTLSIKWPMVGNALGKCERCSEKARQEATFRFGIRDQTGLYCCALNPPWINMSYTFNVNVCHRGHGITAQNNPGSKRTWGKRPSSSLPWSFSHSSPRHSLPCVGHSLDRVPTVPGVEFRCKGKVFEKPVILKEYCKGYGEI